MADCKITLPTTELLSIMMSSSPFSLLLALTVLLHLGGVNSVELTFELPDSAKECFHEIIEKDTESTLEFQVRTLLPFPAMTDWLCLRLLLGATMMSMSY